MATRPAGTPLVAANNVSYAEFLRRKRANPKMKNVTWQGYANYVAMKGNEKAALRAAGTAKYPTVDPAWYARQYAAQLGPMPAALSPLSNQQLRSQAQSMLMPLYTQQADAITKMIQDRSRAGTQAISGYTNAFLKQLPQVQTDIGAIYDEARALQGASSGALADFVRNQGSSMTNELAQAEQAAGQLPTGSQQVGATAAGSSAATAGYDWSTMARLIGQGAASEAYAAQYPAIASAYGQNTLGTFQRDLNTTLEEQLANLQTQSQGDILAMYDSLLNRELQKTQLREGRGEARAGAWAEAMGQNWDSQTAKAALTGQLAGNAAGYNADIAAGTTTPAAGTTATTDVTPRGTQVLQAWKESAPSIASAVSNILVDTDPLRAGVQAKQSFESLMRQVLPMVRSQMGEWNLTEGQLRGFARQVLAMNGIFPPNKALAKAAAAAAAKAREKKLTPKGPQYINPKKPNLTVGDIQRAAPSISGR